MTMIRSPFFVLGLMLICTIWVSLTIASQPALGKKDLPKDPELIAYMKVNAELDKQVPISKPDRLKTMETLRKLLRKEDKRHLFRKRKSHLVQVLKRLVSLSILDGPNPCSEEAVATIANNDWALSQSQLRQVQPNAGPTNQKLTNLVMRFIRQYVDYYGKHCKTMAHGGQVEVEHPQLILNAPEVQLETFMNEVMFRHLCGYEGNTENLDECDLTPSVLNERLARVERFEISDVPIIVRELERRVRKDQKQQEQVQLMIKNRNYGLIKTMIKEHLTGSCQYLVERMSSQLFSPAQLEEELWERNSGSSEQEDPASILHMSWAQFRLCNEVIATPDKLARLIYQWGLSKAPA